MYQHQHLLFNADCTQDSQLSTPVKPDEVWVCPGGTGVHQGLLGCHHLLPGKGKVGVVGCPKPCLHWIAGLCDHQVITARPGYRRCAGCSGDASWGLCTRCRMQVPAPRARMLIRRCYQQGRAARLVRQGQEGQCSPRLPIL